MEEESITKLATVTGFFDDKCPKITFNGEDTASEKKYSYLKSYIPALNDIVLLVAAGDTWVICGKINFDIPPDVVEDFLTEDDLEAYLSANNYVDQSDMKTYVTGRGYVTSTTLSNTLDSYVKDTELSTYLTDNRYLQKSTSSTISLKSGTSYYSEIDSIKSLQIRTDKFGIGKTPVSQKSVSALSTSAELADVITKVNTIISNLKDFGFFY